MQLCSTCKGIFCQTCTLGRATSHHTTMSGFLSASEAGCYICGRLFKDLSDEQREFVRQIVGSDEAITYIEFMNNPGERSNSNNIVVMVSINQHHSELELASAAKGFKQSAQGWLGHSSAIVLQLFKSSGKSRPYDRSISEELC